MWGRIVRFLDTVFRNKTNVKLCKYSPVVIKLVNSVVAIWTEVLFCDEAGDTWHGKIEINQEKCSWLLLKPAQSFNDFYFHV